MIRNRLNLTFGPAGSVAGYVLLLAGIFTIDSWMGILLILIGAFFAFSYSGVKIDRQQGRLMKFTSMFGLFSVGDWEELEPYKELTIIKDNSIFRIASRSNRTMESKGKGYVIYLIGDDIRYRVPICKQRSYELALEEANKISIILDLPLTNINEN